MTFRDFIKWARASDDVIAVRRIYIDMAGDLASGVLLSQIIYWHTPDEHGKPRMQIVHDGYLWIARSREEWWHDCRLTPKQIDRCLPILRDKNFIHTQIIKFMGAPTTHVRINEEGFITALEERMDAIETTSETTQTGGEMEITERVISKSPKGKAQSSAKGKMNLTERVNSINAETTSETTQRNGTSFKSSLKPIENEAARNAYALLSPAEQAYVSNQAQLSGVTLEEAMWQYKQHETIGARRAMGK